MDAKDFIIVGTCGFGELRLQNFAFAMQYLLSQVVPAYITPQSPLTSGQYVRPWGSAALRSLYAPYGGPGPYASAQAATVANCSECAAACSFE